MATATRLPTDAKLIDALAAGPATRDELARRAGLGMKTVSNVVPRLLAGGQVELRQDGRLSIAAPVFDPISPEAPEPEADTMSRRRDNGTHGEGLHRTDAEQALRAAVARQAALPGLIVDAARAGDIEQYWRLCMERDAAQETVQVASVAREHALPDVPPHAQYFVQTRPPVAGERKAPGWDLAPAASVHVIDALAPVLATLTPAVDIHQVARPIAVACAALQRLLLDLEAAPPSPAVLPHAARQVEQLLRAALGARMDVLRHLHAVLVGACAQLDAAGARIDEQLQVLRVARYGLSASERAAVATLGAERSALVRRREPIALQREHILHCVAAYVSGRSVVGAWPSERDLDVQAQQMTRQWVMAADARWGRA